MSHQSPTTSHRPPTTSHRPPRHVHFRHPSLPTRPGVGAVRLGELGLRDDGHGGLLPDLLPAVLERWRRGDAHHVPAGRGQWHGQFHSCGACAFARRHCRSRRSPHQVPCRLHRLGRRDDRGPVLRRTGCLAMGGTPVRRGVARVLGRHDLLRFVAYRRLAARAVRPRLRVRVQPGLSRRRRAVCRERLDDARSWPLRSRVANGRGTPVVSDGRHVVGAVRDPAVPVRGRAAGRAASRCMARDQGRGDPARRHVPRDPQVPGPRAIPARVLAVHRRREHHHEDGGGLRHGAGLPDQQPDHCAADHAVCRLSGRTVLWLAGAADQYAWWHLHRHRRLHARDPLGRDHE